jgi:integrase
VTGAVLVAVLSQFLAVAVLEVVQQVLPAGVLGSDLDACGFQFRLGSRRGFLAGPEVAQPLYLVLEVAAAVLGCVGEFFDRIRVAVELRDDGQLVKGQWILPGRGRHRGFRAGDRLNCLGLAALELQRLLHRPGSHAEVTLRGYWSHIKRLFLPAFGHVPLDKLRGPAHINTMFDGVAENARIRAAKASDDPAVQKTVAGKRETGPATMQRIRATLRSALSDAANDEHPLIAANPARAKAVRLKAAPRPLARVWTDERVTAFWTRYAEATKEMTKTRDKLDVWLSAAMRPYPVMVWTPLQTGVFLDAISDDRLYAMWHLVVFTGMRRGEVAGVRWPDVDLDGALVHVETELVQVGWDVEEDTPKTEASAAPVPFDKSTVTLLRAWRKVRMADQLAVGPDWVSSGRVFTKMSGAALHPERITRMFQQAFDAELPPIRLHDLRHGAATIAHAAGADIKAIQALLRHASHSITADTYTIVLQESQSALAEGMSGVVPRLRAVASRDSAGTSGSTTAAHP